MLGVCSSPISQPKLVETFAGLGLSPQIALVCSQLLLAGLVAELEVSPLSFPMVFSLLAPSLCERMCSPMVFPRCHTSIVSVCHKPMPYIISLLQLRNFALITVSLFALKIRDCHCIGRPLSSNCGPAVCNSRHTKLAPMGPADQNGQHLHTTPLLCFTSTKFALGSVPHINTSHGVLFMDQPAGNFPLPKKLHIPCHLRIALHIPWPKNSF